MKAKIAAIFLFLPQFTSAETPLSAIDWLNQLRSKSENSIKRQDNSRRETANSSNVDLPNIEVSNLSEIRIDAVGLLPPSVTGLPLTIWRDSTTADLNRLLDDITISSNPVIQSLLFRLLLAEGYAPYDSDDSFSFFLSRINKLVEYGAVEPALALLKRAAPLPAQLVPSLFELSMLSEEMSPACDQVLQLGGSYPEYGARIYCHARKGDWLTAQLMLETTAALGTIDLRQEALFHLFLETYAHDPIIAQLPPPSATTFLEFRLYEAIGEPISPSNLPRKFSVSDLSGDHGWKAQLEAAEKLKTSGALADNRFLGIFTSRKPSASGGIWDRVSLIQKFDDAVKQDSILLAKAALQELSYSRNFVTLAGPVSRLFSRKLILFQLENPEMILANRLALLTPNYEMAAYQLKSLSEQNEIEIATATGNFSTFKPKTALEQTIYDGFVHPRIPYAIKTLLEKGKLGEVILTAIIQFHKGEVGDLQDMMDALSTLRLIGLEDTARRAILHHLIVYENE